eukprot:1141958-Pelagomonas_calceolata.AAC.2
MPKKLPKSEERGFGWGEVVMVLARAARETVVAVVVVAISVLAVARGAVWGRGGRGDGEAAGSVREGLSKRKGEEEVVVPGRGTGPVPEGAAAVGERAGPPALGARLEGDACDRREEDRGGGAGGPPVCDGAPLAAAAAPAVCAGGCPATTVTETPAVGGGAAAAAGAGTSDAGWPEVEGVCEEEGGCGTVWLLLDPLRDVLASFAIEAALLT